MNLHLQLFRREFGANFERAFPTAGNEVKVQIKKVAML